MISGLLDSFNVRAAERLFQAIDSAEARGEAAQHLYFYFERTDADPDKAGYYEAIWLASMRRGR